MMYYDGMTELELKTIMRVKQGLSNAEIGQLEFVTVRAVRQRLWIIFKKLGISRRTQLFLLTEFKSRCLCDIISNHIKCPYHNKYKE